MDIVSKARKICYQDELPPRRSSHQKAKTKISPSREYTNDFLRQSFKPVTALSVPSSYTIRQIRRQFIESIRNLSGLYGFKPALDTKKKYPLCIAELFANAKTKMLDISANVELVIIQENDKYPFVATIKLIDTGLTLYYVPIEALQILHQKCKHQAFNLLLSVYAYLYQITGMPLLNDDSYLNQTYTMIEQTYKDSEGELNEQERRDVLYSFTAIRRIAPILNRHIANAHTLTAFFSRIEDFNPVDDFDAKLLALAKQFHALWLSFPKGYFASNNAGEFLHPELEDERAYSDQFFSFCWGFNGWMMDDLMEWVNCDLKEKSAFDVPFSIQKFDKAHSDVLHDCCYQNQLLALLDQLADILNELYA